MEKYSTGRTRTVVHRVRVEESGWYTLELRSFFFDSYLVLRSVEGRALAEDDDGRSVARRGRTDLRRVGWRARILARGDGARARGGGKYTLHVMRGRADKRTLRRNKQNLERAGILEMERFLAAWEGPANSALLAAVDHLRRDSYLRHNYQRGGRA